MFNPEEFLNATQEETEFETSRPLVPAGEHVARIDDVGIRNGISEKTGEPWAALNIKYTITQSEDSEAVGRPVYDSLFLDLDGDTLDRAPGKNYRLGQLLEACGQNGKNWSFSGLKGYPVVISVGHRMNKRTEQMEETVKRVAAA